MRMAAEDICSKKLNGVRVLLAEDSPEIRDIFGGFLAWSGARVCYAENGRVALEMENRTAVDAVVMDLQMPEVTGYEATSCLRRRGFDGVILAVSADPSASKSQDWRSRGFDGFLRKPVDSSTLVSTLSTLLQQKGVTNGGGNLSKLDEHELTAHGAVHQSPRIREIISRFVADLPDRIFELTEAVERNDSEETLQHTHKLKGTAGNCGFPRLMAAFIDLEDQIHAGADFHHLHESVENVARIAVETQHAWNQSETEESPCRKS